MATVPYFPERGHANQDVVRVAGMMKGAGTSVPVKQTGRGWSIARTAQGHLTITFRDKYPYLLHFSATVCSTDPDTVDYTVQLDLNGKTAPYVASSGTIDIRIMDNAEDVAGAPVPLDLAATDFLTFEAVFQRSSLPSK